MNNNNFEGNFEAYKYTGGNPKLYFAKAIKVQQMAFKADYAEKKLNQSCKTLISSGFCHGCMDCKLCALQAAHDETMRVLSDPEKAHKRYLKWLEVKQTNEAFQPINYGAVRSYDGKGHKTEVSHQTSEERAKAEIERRKTNMERITKKHNPSKEEDYDDDIIIKKESNRDKKRAKHEARERQEKKNRYDSRWN